MVESTGIVKFIINSLEPKSKPELYDFEYEFIMENLSSKEHLLNDLINKMWCLGDLPSVRNHNRLPSLIDSKVGMRRQISTWFASKHDLTPSQEKLNKELLYTLNLISYYSSSDDTDPLEKFLHDNKDSKDLKVILNLKRGESESTVLHAVAGGKIDEYSSIGGGAIDLLLGAGADPNIQNNKGETPLYLAAAMGHYDNANSLLLKGANPNITSRKGKTPQRIATDNLCYHMEELFLTDKQKKLNNELYDLLVLNSDCTKNLKDFLSKYEGDSDLKVVLNIWSTIGQSKVLLHIDNLSWEPKDENSVKQLKKMVLEAGALDYSNIDYPQQEEGQTSTLLVKLTSNQKKKLSKFSGKVSQAKNMVELEEIVNDAIKSGVRLNYSSSQDCFSGDEYTFTDYVIKEISKLEGNPKVASNIICQLVSKGAMFGNTVDVNILTSEFKEHETNMKKAYSDYIRSVHKFIEVAKSATNSELKDVRIDNSVFYLEYSKDSKIDIIKVTDGARDLSLTDGEVKCGRSIVKIGNSEVEIKTEDGIRNYADLTEGSDVVLTFYTSLENVDVRLYPDVQDKSKIIVEVSNREEILEKFKGRKGELGNNCKLGNYWVYDAIEQGYFEKSVGLIRPEVINKSTNKWTEREELRRTSDPRRGVSR